MNGMTTSKLIAVMIKLEPTVVMAKISLGKYMSLIIPELREIDVIDPFNERAKNCQVMTPIKTHTGYKRSCCFAMIVNRK